MPLRNSPAARTRAHESFDLDAELVAQAFGGREHLGPVRIADHLHVAFAVAQVDKDDATVIAAAVDPAAQGDGLADQGIGHKTAVVGTHGHGFSFKNEKPRSICAEHRSLQLDVSGDGHRFGNWCRGSRHDNPHRNDVFQRFIDAHFQFHDIGTRKHQKEAGLLLIGAWKVAR